MSFEDLHGISVIVVTGVFVRTLRSCQHGPANGKVPLVSISEGHLTKNASIQTIFCAADMDSRRRDNI